MSFAAAGDLYLTVSARQTDARAISVAKVIAASRTSNIERLPFTMVRQRSAGWLVQAGLGNEWRLLQLLANAHNGLAEEEPTKMNMKAIIAAVTFTAIAVPAFADAYLSFRDAKTRKCTITATKPATTETTVVGDGTVYKTLAEAETGMKSVKACRSNQGNVSAVATLYPREHGLYAAAA